MRFNIASDGGKDHLHTSTGLLVSSGFERIVIGKRGPYVEFVNGQIEQKTLKIPKKSAFRLSNDLVYYIEYRTRDDAFVKVYHQKKPVAYADYKIGMWYISPKDLFLADGTPVVAPAPTPLALFED